MGLALVRCGPVVRWRFEKIWIVAAFRLTTGVRYSIIDVMVQDIDTGGIAPPQPRVDDTVDIRGFTESDIEDHVSTLLASVGDASNSPSAGVPSLVAVWVISQVEKACGAGPLIDAKTLTRDDFATPTALSRVLHRRIREKNAPFVES